MQGRFTSPDEFKGGPDELFDFEDDASSNPTFYAELEIPQSLNKYQYSYNNPYKYNDPTGHCIGALAPAAPWCIRGGIEVTKVLAPVIGGAIAAAGAVVIDIITSTPNTAGDPACPACNSSQRMGQSMMANSKSSGNVKANTAVKAEDAKVSSTPPNPNGKNGGPKHQKKVKEAEKEVRQKGLRAKREYMVKTPDGKKSKRFVDVAGVDKKTGKPKVFVQVGKARKDGKPIKCSDKLL